MLLKDIQHLETAVGVNANIFYLSMGMAVGGIVCYMSLLSAAGVLLSYAVDLVRYTFRLRVGVEFYSATARGSGQISWTDFASNAVV